MYNPLKPINMASTNKRNLSEIAKDVINDIDVKNPKYYGMLPYLTAMKNIHSSDPAAPYLFEDADSIVRYFLSNASVWRGETARRIKQELKSNYNIK